MAATVIYGMWKNYRNQAPVEVVLLDAGRRGVRGDPRPRRERDRS